MSEDVLSSAALAQLVPRLELPCFLYAPSVLAHAIASVREAFSAYYYPIKANAHPKLVRTAITAGAELDLCSDGDLEIAAGVGGLTTRTSYTGAGLTQTLMRRIAASGIAVNLDSLQEVTLWTQVAPARACGMRLRLSATLSTYATKFGATVAEIREARDVLRRAGVKLAGIHVHDAHRGRSPSDAASVLAAALDELDPELVRDLDYVALGGGWPFAYEGEVSWRLDDVCRAMKNRPIAVLRAKGFAGEIRVEPGEFVVSPAGVWLASVAVVKERPHCGERVVILDTPTPVPFADIAYPIEILRKMNDTSYSPQRSSALEPCALYGSTNTGRDRIRRDVGLPHIVAGDIVIVRDVGAYVHALIGHFNERQPPRVYVLPLEV